MPPWCSYLWPASLSKEPVVRIGLEGLTQVGSGVFCTSVLTSGSISEGEGVSFAPAMVPSGTSSREPVCSFLPPPPPPPPPGVGAQAQSVRQSATEGAGKPHPPDHCCCSNAEGARLLLCRITGSSRAH
ncbi:unnamed protein product [Pleuronectes platessa]|uniref:Uncharacterized protein n=1 Tax=Pleuronectes platessa TaxID=8262 RepID=A0A9N7UKU4_PLEPL|nr:unnamed protein product [Pleuronectes platessa]